MVYCQTVQASNLCLLHLSQTTHCTSYCHSSCCAKRKEIDQLKIDNKTKCQLHLQQHIFSWYNMYIFSSHHNCHHMVHENANLTSSFHVNWFCNLEGLHFATLNLCIFQWHEILVYSCKNLWKKLDVAKISSNYVGILLVASKHRKLRRTI